MTKSLFSLLILSFLFLISCKKELVPQDSATVPITQSEDSSATSTTEIVTNSTSEPSEQQMQMEQTAAITPKGMNPPHGQAGHDCSIAVGAPLNSAKNTNTAQANPITINPSNSQNSNSSTPAILNPNAQTETAPGMNPPHGKEGHRCEIAVGEPLPK